MLLGAVVAALTGSAVFGAVAAGVVMSIVAIVALEAFATREIVAHGGISWERPRARAANVVPPAGGAGGAGPGDGCGAGGFDGGGGGGGDGGGGGC